MMKIVDFLLGKRVLVALIGPTNRMSDLRQLAHIHGADAKKVCIINAPSDSNGAGYQSIASYALYGASRNPEARDLFGEGVVLTEKNSAAVIRTADCPTLVLFEKTTGKVLVTHAGRAAMTPTNKLNEPICNIVTKAHALLTKDCAKPDVSAHIVGSICPNCFPHEDEHGQKLIVPFNQFPDSVVIKDKQRGTLDLPSLITWQLVELGVSPGVIRHDGICTHETPWLASYRRDKNKARNVVLIVKH